MYLALDNDEAGLKNQAKVARELGPLTLLMPPIEGFKDANDFLQKSGDANLITRQLEDSQVFLSKLIEDATHSSGHHLLDLVEQIIEMLKQLPHGLRPFYSRATEAALDMTSQELRGLLSDEDQLEVSQAQEPEDRPQMWLLNEALAEGRVLVPKSYGKPYLVEQGVSEWGKVVYGIGGTQSP